MPDPLSVPCPECTAPAGEPCQGVMRRGLHARPRVTPHRARVTKAEQVARERRHYDLNTEPELRAHWREVTDEVTRRRIHALLSEARLQFPSLRPGGTP